MAIIDTGPSDIEKKVSDSEKQEYLKLTRDQNSSDPGIWTPEKRVRFLELQTKLGNGQIPMSPELKNSLWQQGSAGTMDKNGVLHQDLTPEQRNDIADYNWALIKARREGRS